MDKIALANKLSVEAHDVLMYEEKEGRLKVLYSFESQYIVLVTDDIDDESEGASLATPNYEEALTEYEQS
jgi:hypothetical protein